MYVYLVIVHRPYNDESHRIYATLQAAQGFCVDHYSNISEDELGEWLQEEGENAWYARSRGHLYEIQRHSIRG